MTEKEGGFVEEENFEGTRSQLGDGEELSGRAGGRAEQQRSLQIPRLLSFLLFVLSVAAFTGAIMKR